MIICNDVVVVISEVSYYYLIYVVLVLQLFLLLLIMIFDILSHFERRVIIYIFTVIRCIGIINYHLREFYLESRFSSHTISYLLHKLHIVNSIIVTIISIKLSQYLQISLLVLAIIKIR